VTLDEAHSRQPRPPTGRGVSQISLSADHQNPALRVLQLSVAEDGIELAAADAPVEAGGEQHRDGRS
jgi:hypothetical protein